MNFEGLFFSNRRSLAKHDKDYGSFNYPQHQKTTRIEI